MWNKYKSNNSILELILMFIPFCFRVYNNYARPGSPLLYYLRKIISADTISDKTASENLDWDSRMDLGTSQQADSHIQMFWFFFHYWLSYKMTAMKAGQGSDWLLKSCEVWQYLLCTIIPRSSLPFSHLARAQRALWKSTVKMVFVSTTDQPNALCVSKNSGSSWSCEPKRKRSTPHLKSMKDSPRNRGLRTALENQPSWVKLQPDELDTSPRSGSCNSHKEKAS